MEVPNGLERTELVVSRTVGRNLIHWNCVIGDYY